MNICLLSMSPFHPLAGGVGCFSSLMAKQLQKRGHHCVCASCASSSSSVKGCPVVQLPELGEALVSSLHAVLAQHSVDVLWLQSLDESLLTAASEACRRTGAKLVCLLHVEPKSKLKGYRDCLAQAWYHACKGRAVGAFLYFFARYPLGVLLNAWRERRRYRLIYALADRLVLLSSRYKTEFVSMAGLHDGGVKLAAIPNPLTLELVSPAEKKQKELLYVGRMPWQHKRVDRLLRIWKMLQDEFPDWRFTFVGGGDSLDTYRELALDMGLERISFVGAQSPSSYYARASIFCLSSSFEGYPLVLKEAQAYGCVPVCFASFASAYDIIESGKTGLLVPPFQLESYADALRQLMQNPQLRQDLARSAEQSAHCFTPEAAAEQWEQLFLSLTAR